MLSSDTHAAGVGGSAGCLRGTSAHTLARLQFAHCTRTGFSLRRSGHGSDRRAALLLEHETLVALGGDLGEALEVEGPPRCTQNWRGLPGMFAPVYQESVRG